MRYSILLNGRNLLAEVEGSLQYLDFYTTRTVEAGSKAEAESLAIALIRRDKKLLQLMRNEADDPPTFSVEEIVELVDESATHNTGFSFYRETNVIGFTVKSAFLSCSHPRDEGTDCDNLLTCLNLPVNETHLVNLRL